jgi:sugar phosphate isomerase/epimerase
MSPVRLALTPDGGRNDEPDALAEAAAAAGFQALGVSGRAAGPDTQRAWARAGLACHEILALAVTADAERTVATATRLAGAARTMGAEWVLTVFAAPIGPDVEATLRDCAAVVSEAGARMAMEFSPLGPVADIPHALRSVEAAGVERSGVMIDSWHLCHGGGLADLQTVPLEAIAYVQFADALPAAALSPAAGASLMTETMDRRAMPGDGELDLHRFADTLLGRGWDGTVSVEVLSESWRSAAVEEFATAAHRTTERYWSR